MKASEVHNMTEVELNKKLKDFRIELFNLRFQSITGQLGNPKRIQMVRKDIARIKTALQEKHLLTKGQEVRRYGRS